MLVPRQNDSLNTIHSNKDSFNGTMATDRTTQKNSKTGWNMCRKSCCFDKYVVHSNGDGQQT